MNLPQIVEQLESCGFECETGLLTENVAFQKLKMIAETGCAFCLEATEYRFKEQCKECKSAPEPVCDKDRFYKVLRLAQGLISQAIRPNIPGELSPNEIRLVAELIMLAVNAWYPRQGGGPDES